MLDEVELGVVVLQRGGEPDVVPESVCTVTGRFIQGERVPAILRLQTLQHCFQLHPENRGDFGWPRGPSVPLG